jgi:hypothetical protein
MEANYQKFLQQEDAAQQKQQSAAATYTVTT